MDANRHRAKLSSIVCDHLSPSTLVKLLSSELRGRHIRKHAERAILSSIHSCVAVGVIAHVWLHKLQFICHLLASMLLQCWLCSYFRIFNEGKSRSPHFILLVLADVRQFGLLSRLMFLIFTPLLDWGESWLVSLAELAIDVRSLNRLEFLASLIKCFVHAIDHLYVRLSALLSQLGDGPCIRYLWTRRMLRVSLSDRQKVIVIKNDTTFLHDSEGA